MADPMTLDEAQKRIDAWLQKRGGYWSPLSQYARLAEEVGELGRELNHQFGDKPRTGKDRRGAIADELGDVLFIVVALANDLKVNLDRALQQTLKKYERRP
jgi:NTP pyrophosphatase (non-canonical NTP hydrolase)